MLSLIDKACTASQWLQHPERISIADSGRQGIGQSMSDQDGVAKVAGCLEFADDIYLENMLYGKIVFSRYPHAEILAVDTTPAQSIPGVKAVLTAEDVPGLNGMGSLTPDQPVLCQDRVRFTGDVVAVVFAETPAAAELAVRLRLCPI